VHLSTVFSSVIVSLSAPRTVPLLPASEKCHVAFKLNYFIDRTIRKSLTKKKKKKTFLC